jgi:hypothetical protein
VDKPSGYKGRHRKDKNKRPWGTKVTRALVYIAMSQAVRLLLEELFDLASGDEASDV